ncbi:alanine racemase [Sphingomonas sp. DT-204]|uniref:alanine racemase n=1 Tax=Sphingomonas sp. DT-204 TaxID=3396166 RepID=UPI003F19FACE
MPFAELETPTLLLDRERLDHNLARMRRHLARFPHVRLRPHLKTAKSVEVARLATDGPITVSTLKEAEVFADAGYSDILYAVGLSPDKLPRVARLGARGVAMTVILDNLPAAQAAAGFARSEGAGFKVLIEIDTDGHRGGLRPGDPAIVEVGRALAGAGLLAGVLTHCGGSYAARSEEALRAFAAQERDGVVAAAAMLREAGLPCPVASVGSTPTALFAEDLAGVTEVRAGVYVFQDLVMAGIGVCAIDEIAISVLATVIGHQSDRGHVIVDAGWMAMSRDRGTQAQPVDQGYGLVLDLDQRPLDDAVMIAANQEHGVIAGRGDRPLDLACFPIGRRLRILPNHACATAAQYSAYTVTAGERVVGCWPRFNAW